MKKTIVLNDNPNENEFKAIRKKKKNPENHTNVKKTIITFSTHNVNGFKRNKSFLQSRCRKVKEINTIHCLQETWLKEVNDLKDVHEEFEEYGKVSTKKNKKGRPHGGVAFLWNKKFSNFIIPLKNLEQEQVKIKDRVIAIKVKDILCINTYLPCLDTSKIGEQKKEYIKTLNYIKKIIEKHNSYRVVVLGDLNCKLFDDKHHFTPYLRNFMKQCKLICTFELCKNFNVNTDFSHTGRAGKKSLLDYVLISKDLKSDIRRVFINHYFNNLSDHRPVSVDIELPLD